MDKEQGAEKILADKLTSAAEAIVPAEEIQRQTVAALMPQLCLLRNKGFDWKQLAALLRECGISLQPSTVRVYYSEMLDERAEEFQRKFTEQLVMLSEINKTTNSLRDAAPLPECDTEILAGLDSHTNKHSSESTPPHSSCADGEATSLLVCLELRPGVRVLPVRPGVDLAVYESCDLMEHPCIPGLFLSREARAYNDYLEYRMPDGEVKTETSIQKNQRIKWEKPAGMFPSSTAHTFVKMNPAHFKEE